MTSKSFITIGCGYVKNDIDNWLENVSSSYAFKLLDSVLAGSGLTCDDFVLTKRHYEDWAFFYLKSTAKDEIFHRDEEIIRQNAHRLLDQKILTYAMCVAN